MTTRLLILVLLGVAASHARAALGDTVASIDLDTARLGEARRVVVASASISAGVRTHVITLSDGSVIKEFVGSDDRVFAITWNTRFKPRLDGLLGQFASTYATAAGRAARSPGIRHGLAVNEGDLVVNATAHLNAHTGIAYLHSLVPADVRIDELR
jgi:hypothetical protein